MEKLVHIGSVFTCDGKSIQDIERKRAGGTQAFGTLKRRLWGRRDVSLKIFNAVVQPVLLHGTTAWALTRTEERRLYAFEMRMLKRIMEVGWDNGLYEVEKSQTEVVGARGEDGRRKASEKSNECGDGR